MRSSTNRTNDTRKSVPPLLLPACLLTHQIPENYCSLLLAYVASIYHLLHPFRCATIIWCALRSAYLFAYLFKAEQKKIEIKKRVYDIVFDTDENVFSKKRFIHMKSGTFSSECYAREKERKTDREKGSGAVGRGQPFDILLSKPFRFRL